MLINVKLNTKFLKFYKLQDANYHNKKNGTTPKNASSYQADTSKHGWRCTVCGFILEADELPEDFICPVCKQPASVFEKI